MREDSPSRTAAWVAAARGLGTLLPERARLVEDPYGVAFASPRLARLLERADGTLRGAAAIPGMGEWVLYMQVRTRVLDDIVRAFAGGGGRQLVLLGAGYDCRALRLAPMEVFEIDHPATQRRKQAVLARLGAVSPARYLGWDFEARPVEELPRALAEAGHDATRPTLTLWEGVTMYLTEAAVDASVRAIRDYSAPGSKLAFTYSRRPRGAPPSPSRLAIRAMLARIGEPWRWGWNRSELPAWMAARGLTVESDQSIAQAADELLPADLARRVAVVARESIAVAAPEAR